MSEHNLPFHSSPVERYAVQPAIAGNYWPRLRHMVPNPCEDEWYFWSFPNDSDFKQHRREYNATVQWIYSNVEDWNNNAMWRKIGDCYYVRLRNEADAVMFTLKFGKANERSV